MNQLLQPDSAAYESIIPEVTQKKKATRREITRVMRDLASKRATALTPERRSEIARAAAKARWAKKGEE
jgi:hypothetical protein